MKQRLYYLLWCAAFLLTGVALYWLFRSGTYLHRVLPPAPTLQLPPCIRILCACYLPDLLWCAALSCALFCLFLPRGRKKIAVVILSASVGIGWELCQKYGLVSGTADAVDCILYITGASVPVLITKK